MDTTVVNAVAERVRAQMPAALDQLRGYLTIPAISCQPGNYADVRRLAEKIRDDLTAIGMARARVLDVQVDGDVAMPAVAAEWMGAGADKPTVLIYGHLDLQPVGEPEWATNPHEMVQKGDRMYARGVSDDMGGWLSHLAAMKAWFDVTGSLPCNVRLLIEGEEEIGSPYLEKFIDAYPDAFKADVMVLTDCENPAVDVPGLTVSLRGLLEVELVCDALQADVHSGIWGNMAPDPTIAMFQLVNRLIDGDGRMKIARMDVDEARKEAGRLVPMGPDVVREGAHLLPDVSPLPERDKSAAEWLWWQPAVTVLATSIPPIDKKKNAIRRRCSATLSVRLAPGQSGEQMLAALKEVLLVDPPQGVRVALESKPGWGESWLYRPQGPAFEAADRAYVRAWGRKLVQIGIGGTIPFVAMFGRRFGDLPLILNGVLDPLSTAHGPNESLHLGVFEKMLVTNVWLYAELAEAVKP